MKKHILFSMLAIFLASSFASSAARAGPQSPAVHEVARVVSAATEWYAEKARPDGRIERVQISRVPGATLMSWRKSETAQSVFSASTEYWLVSFRVTTMNTHGAPVVMFVRCVVDPATYTVVE